MRVVAGLWKVNGAVFGAQRPLNKAHGGLWELPGGKVDPGETDNQALAREWREELAVQIEVKDHLITIVTDHIELWVYLICCDEQPTLLEHTAGCWLQMERLFTVPWASADHQVMLSLTNER